MKLVDRIRAGRTFAVPVTAEQLDTALEQGIGRVVQWEAVELGDRDALWSDVALVFEGVSKDGKPFVLFDYWGPQAINPITELSPVYDMGQALQRYPTAQAVEDDEETRGRAALVSDWVAPWAVPLGEGVRDAAKSLRGWALGGLGVAAVVGLAVVLSSGRRRR